MRNIYTRSTAETQENLGQNRAARRRALPKRPKPWPEVTEFFIGDPATGEILGTGYIRRDRVPDPHGLFDNPAVGRA